MGNLAITPGLARSAFHVGEFGGDFAVADGEDVYAADVPGLAVAHFAIDPEHYGAIAGDEIGRAHV